MDYLEYAYLQSGEVDKAKAVRGEMQSFASRFRAHIHRRICFGRNSGTFTALELGNLGTRQPNRTLKNGRSVGAGNLMDGNRSRERPLQ